MLAAEGVAYWMAVCSSVTKIVSDELVTSDRKRSSVSCVPLSSCSVPLSRSARTCRARSSGVTATAATIMMPSGVSRMSGGREQEGDEPGDGRDVGDEVGEDVRHA